MCAFTQRTDLSPFRSREKTWSGTVFRPTRKNGPLTLMVPNGYQSGFVVESRNYAPMSCQASICDNARKTWTITIAGSNMAPRPP